MSSSIAGESDRPDHPIFAACSTADGRVPKKIPFRSARTLSVVALKERISQTFSLEASSFHIAYRDDEEGEDCQIHTEDELTDAIWYFMSGNDMDDPTSVHSSSTRQKTYITLQFRIILEYDGPSLSDTSSIAESFQDSLNIDDEYASSAYTYSSEASSARSGRSAGAELYNNEWNTTRSSSSFPSRRVRDEVIEEESEHGSGTHNSGVFSLEDDAASDDGTVSYPFGTPTRAGRPDMTSATSGNGGSLTVMNDFSSPGALRHLSRSSSSSSGSSCTSSEFGARWIEEQKARAAKTVGAKSVRGELMEDGTTEAGDAVTEYESGRGRLKLKMDSRGRYCYVYTSSDMHLLAGRYAAFSPYSFSDGREVTQTSAFASSQCTSILSAHISEPDEEEPFQEASFPPTLTPDCSACGTRLEYMRYICTICGPSQPRRDLGDSHEVGTLVGFNHQHGSRSARSDAESDGESTSTRRAASFSSSGTVGGLAIRTSRTGSDGRSRSIDEVVSPLGSSETDLDPFLHYQDDDLHEISSSNGARNTTSHGFELCPGCIENQGIAHTRDMGTKMLRSEPVGGNPGLARKLRHFGAMDHTYREMIWSATGWRDIKYLDSASCSICNVSVDQKRFKCITCPTFDLCKSCHQNAQEIHPTHAFLAVPDSHDGELASGFGSSPRQEKVKRDAVVHPGVFCHNCLQDIRGARYHCVICPAWDLCSECRMLDAPLDGLGEHVSSHIVLKITIPLSSQTVSQVAGRAEESWHTHDSALVRNGKVAVRSSLSRSPSPTNETIYGGQTSKILRKAGKGAISSQRDTPMHDLTCQGCQESIRGKRYQCANCPSDPVGYNLCSECEPRAHFLHDPMHFYVRFDRRVDLPLKSPQGILPVLYRLPVGHPRYASQALNPVDYLQYVTHQSTLCDIHVGPIQGAWLRCAHCACSFDICEACEHVAEHDRNHAFVVFKSEVDMRSFRSLITTMDTHGQSLIKQRVYV